MNKNGGHYKFILDKKKDSTRPKVILHCFCMSVHYIYSEWLILSIWIYKIAVKKLKKKFKKKTKTCITCVSTKEICIEKLILNETTEIIKKMTS